MASRTLDTFPSQLELIAKGTDPSSVHSPTATTTRTTSDGRPTRYLRLPAAT